MKTAPPTDGSVSTVLIVDDTPENLQVLAELLQPLYRVRAANSGRRALKVAATPPLPDLILLDVMMPDLDGYQVLKSLRANPVTRDVPVIFVTGMTAAEDEQFGLGLGAVDYITKPIRPQVVLARVQNQLEWKRFRDQLRGRNAVLEAEISLRHGENLLIQDVSIHALARLAEIRDSETGDHLHRTQAYIRILAEELRSHPRFGDFLSSRNIELISKCAPLHDIGKVGIPDYILRKPGPLTEAEWEIMKTHARLGSEAIEQAERDADRQVDFLVLAKEIAHFHHERWDGFGYPDGLAGERIPIAARLMALADVFDALISTRIYKPPMSHEAARNLILRDRGRHFDPDVVDAFSARFEAFKAVAERYREARANLPGDVSLQAGGRARPG